MKLNVPFFASSSAKNKLSRSGRRSSKDRGGGAKSGSFSSTASSSSSDESTTPRTVLPPPLSAERKPPPPPVTRADLEVALRRVVASEEELALMLAEAESAGLDDVLEGLAAAEAQPADEAELRDAFAVFDADGDGRISADELRAVLGSLGEHHACSADDCQRMIRAVDADGDGFVCFDEFSRMMMHGL